MNNTFLYVVNGTLAISSAGALVFAALSWWQARGAKREAREAKQENRLLRSELAGTREKTTGND